MTDVRAEADMVCEEGCATSVRALLESTGTPFETVRYPRRSVLFLQGDEGDSIMQIESGCVRLAVTSPGGREATYPLLEKGAFLGEEILAGVPFRRHTAIAITETEVIAVAKRNMSRLLQGDDTVLDRFLAYVLGRHVRLETELAEQLLYASEHRLAHTLLALSHCQGTACRCALPEIPQEIVAEMVGTTRSRVNALLGKFKRRGFIEERDGVLYVTSALLAALQDRDVAPLEPPARERRTHAMVNA